MSIIVNKTIRPIIVSKTKRAVVVDHVDRPIEVVSEPRPIDVTVVKRPITVTNIGMQGPRGEPGGSIPQIDFSYGDAAGVIWTPDAPGVLTEVSIDFVVPFNGFAPSVILGTLSDPDCIMSALHSAPTVEAEFENTANVRLAIGESVRIAITPSGSTAGNGHIYLTFLPD